MKYRLHYKKSEFQLSPGEFVIGRSSQCQLALDDPLVSRRHAVIVVANDGATVRDLGSRNGVLVNGDDVGGERALHPGDVVKIGGQELTFQLRSESQSSTVRQSLSTQRSDAFAVLSALADKAFAMGRSAEAERLLSAHLQNVLTTVEEGGRLAPQTAEQATLYAARLAAATGDGRWFDYVFQVFETTGRLCPGAVVDELYAAVRKVDRVDAELIRGYVASIHAGLTDLGPADRFGLKRLEGLAEQARLK